MLIGVTHKTVYNSVDILKKISEKADILRVSMVLNKK